MDEEYKKEDGISDHKEHSHKTSHEQRGHEEHPHKASHEQHGHKEHPVHKTHVHHDKSEHKDSEKKSQKRVLKFNLWKGVAIALLVLLIVSVYTNGFRTDKNGASALPKDAAASKALAYINSVLLQGEAPAKLLSVEDGEGVYNLKLELNGRPIDGFITKDGSLFFPQGIPIDEDAAGSGTPSSQPSTPPPAPQVVKSEKPVVELFIMSHCPYGTQAEKGILPVANLLGEKIDFEVKFVYYAMHGKKEMDEQANQECIKKEYPTKFNDYLACFLEGDDGPGCLTEMEIDSDKLAKCVADLDEEFGLTAAFEDQSSWLSGKFPLFNVHKADNDKYDVGGSPTLVINGAQASSARSPAAYLATICAAFEEPPKECTESEGVSAETYSPGFGYEIGAATAASCG
jgi:hypothetical protein